MDQPALPLKAFKKRRSKKKSHSLFLKRKRLRKKQIQHRGQVLMEGLFFIIFIFSFLLTVQFFQSQARKEIQKERLSRQAPRKIKRSSWFKGETRPSWFKGETNSSWFKGETNSSWFKGETNSSWFKN